MSLVFVERLEDVGHGRDQDDFEADHLLSAYFLYAVLHFLSEAVEAHEYDFLDALLQLLHDPQQLGAAAVEVHLLLVKLLLQVLRYCCVLKRKYADVDVVGCLVELPVVLPDRFGQGSQEPIVLRKQLSQVGLVFWVLPNALFEILGASAAAARLLRLLESPQ